jgi:hypothetical protein
MECRRDRLASLGVDRTAASVAAADFDRHPAASTVSTISERSSAKAARDRWVTRVSATSWPPRSDVCGSATHSSGSANSITVSSLPVAPGKVRATFNPMPLGVAETVQVTEVTPASPRPKGTSAIAAAIRGSGLRDPAGRVAETFSRWGRQTSLQMPISMVPLSCASLPALRSDTRSGNTTSS